MHFTSDAQVSHNASQCEEFLLKSFVFLPYITHSQYTLTIQINRFIKCQHQRSSCLEKDMLLPLPHPQIKQPLYSCYLINIISKKKKKRKKVYTNTNVHKCCFYHLNGIQQNSTAF